MSVCCCTNDTLGLGSGPDSLGETRPGDRSIARPLLRHVVLAGQIFLSSLYGVHLSPQDIPEHLDVV